jgi:hypothetical protein
MARIGDYFRAAVLHPWNLVLLGAGVVSSIGLGSEVPAMLAAGVELAYLGIVPASARFRRAVDARLARRDRRLQGAKLDAMIAELAPNQREHFQALRQVADRIEQNHARLEGTHGGLLMEQTRVKIQALLRSFLKLLISLNDYRRFLSATDRQVIERDLKELEDDLARTESESEAVREVKKRRAEILRMRLERFRKAEESRELISHQLASIEDMLRLVLEQSITLRDPEAIGRQLDALSVEVEETESTVREMERFLSLASETEGVARPPTRVR